MDFNTFLSTFSAALGVDEQVGLVLAATLFSFWIMGVWALSRAWTLDPDGAAPGLEEEADTSIKVRETEAFSEALPRAEEASAAGEAITEAKPETLEKKLAKTKRGFFEKIRAVFSSGVTLNQDTLEELKYALIGSDIGVKTVTKLIDELSASLKRGEEVSEDILVSRLKAQLSAIISEQSESALESLIPGRVSPYILMLVGVNGVGKTTTCAKLAQKCVDRGLTVLLVAADTFRAAAVSQLQSWAQRLNVPVVSGADNAKPQSVVFDAMVRAKEGSFDVIIIDTAGRLHTKANLMQELEGVRNAIERHFPEGPSDVFLVVDGSTGQNALAQAKEFNDAVKLTGVIVTKLDGSPKGGIVVAIKDEFGIPVRYIGVGESAMDLRPFSPLEFIDAILNSSADDGYTHTEEKVSAHAATRRRRREEVKVSAG